MTKEENNTKGKLVKSINVAILVALIGFIGSITSSAIKHRSSIKVEKEKLESNLILKAIDTDDRKKSIANLKFLMEMGFIKNHYSQLSELLDNPEKQTIIPALKSQGVISQTIKILNPSGQPQNGVSVFHNKVYIGTTDKNGDIISLIEQGLAGQEISVYKSEKECVYHSFEDDGKVLKIMVTCEN